MRAKLKNIIILKPIYTYKKVKSNNSQNNPDNKIVEVVWADHFGVPRYWERSTHGIIVEKERVDY